MTSDVINLGEVEIKNDYITDELISFKDKLEEALANVGTPASYKDTQMDNDYLQPYIPLHLARYAYHHSSTLRSIIESFSQDVFLNEYSLSDPEEDATVIDKLWNNVYNKYQLYLAGIDWQIYGYGVAEITDNGREMKVSQIPAHLVRLRKIPFHHPLLNRTYYFYYCEQNVNGVQVLLRLVGYDYSMLDDFGVDHGSRGVCIWIGGCNETPFFDIPRWIAKRRSLFTDMAIDEYNSRKIERGNINAGLLLITGPLERKDPSHPDKKTIDETIEDGLRGGDSGTLVQYLGSSSTSQPVDMKYQVFEDNNYEYFGFLQDRCVDDLLKAFKMPKVRLAIDDTKESMNSHKSDSLYEIYNREIFASQMFVQPVLDVYDKYFMGVKSDVVISTPEFTDKTSTRVSTAVELFNEGLFTLAMCFELLAPVYPNIDFTCSDSFSEDLLNTRFYHGQPLGGSSIGGGGYDGLDELGGVLDGVNELLVGDGFKPLQYPE
ncbi:MAG: hypothetical protein BZ136_08495 [Methanosphaera sp. rholeuAM74]|nr:MAG: hypothetical protein BZ136_08495 [Methanosphaera sp. rholeuAM74]